MTVRPRPGADDRPPRRAVRWDLASVLLAGGSGGVDVLAFTALGHVFAGVMTGNLVLLGLGLSGTAQAVLLAPVLALVGYSAAVGAVARSLRTAGEGPPWPLARRWLLAESVLLLALAVAWVAVGPPAPLPVSWQRGLLVGLAVAMGLQSGALAAVGGAAGPGTFFTGTLTQALVRAGRSGRGGAREAWDLARLAALAAAAAATAALRTVWADGAAFLPALLVTAAVVLIARSAEGTPAPLVEQRP